MEKIIRIGSSEINVKWIDRNPGSKTVVVFLHEALGSVVQWKTFPDQVCDALKLNGLIIERSGHGKSGGLTEMRNERYLHNYTHETKSVLDEVLPVDAEIILTGHSDGGTIALLYAKLFPKNILGIVTMAAHTFVEPETLAGIRPAVDAYEQGKLDGLKRIHGDKTDELFYAWADTWRAPFFLNWDIRREIKGLKIPVLAIQGEEDQYGTVKQLESIAEAGDRVTTILLKACGHHPHIEKREEVTSLIVEWIKTLLSDSCSLL